MNTPKIIIIIFVISVCIVLSVIIWQIWTQQTLSAEAFSLSQEVQTLKLKKEIAEIERQAQKDEYDFTLTRSNVIVNTAQTLGMMTVKLWPVWLVSIAGFALFSFGRAHSSITVTEQDGHSVTTRIPIIQATQQERIMLASAQVVRNLALAQGDVNDQTRQMIQTISHAAKDMSAVTPRYGSKIIPALPQHDDRKVLESVNQHVPTLATLLEQGELAQGKPLIIGYSNGEPQYNLLTALKTLAVTGWQGSGKTVSVAYLVATAVLAHAGNILCIVLDPHSEHEEGLSSYLQPLKERRLIDVPNLFHFHDIWNDLNAQIDRRLSGQESSESQVLVIADEMGNLLRRDDKGLMTQFLDRATEETRKTKMTFVGISHKWTARHFKGHADIRRCMNSLLIHKTKPSNAEMLIEDMGKDVKHQLKQITQPGEGLFVRDFGEPIKIRMPYTRKQDIQTIADMASAYTQKEGNRILTPEELQTRIRDMLSPELKLKDVYERVFPGGNEMTLNTFLTKFKNPEGRPWNPSEQRRLSQWVERQAV